MTFFFMLFILIKVMYLNAKKLNSLNEYQAFYYLFLAANVSVSLNVPETWTIEIEKLSNLFK